MSDLSRSLEPLNQTHRRSLLWFADRKGQLVSWPGEVDGLFLVNKAKGIHKPAGWEHALSVRQSQNSPYADQPPQGSPEDAWTYLYFQEGHEPKERDRYATNRGIMACLRDNVPLAVIIQEKPKPKPQYRVWGLAKVTSWDNGYFKLIGYDADGNISTSAPDLDYSLLPSTFLNVAEETSETDELIPPPLDLTDARKKIDASIRLRQGGAKFRKEGLKIFSGRCAVTGFNVASVLEAAHIVPYLGEQTNTPDNCLILRADIHTLFDRQLLKVCSKTLTVRLADELKNSPYGDLDGRPISRPTGIPDSTLIERLSQREKVLSKAS